MTRAGNSSYEINKYVKIKIQKKTNKLLEGDSLLVQHVTISKLTSSQCSKVYKNALFEHLILTIYNYG